MSLQCVASVTRSPLGGAPSVASRHEIDSREFRNLLGRFPTGVAVVTSRSPEGKLIGMTINSFASVSLDPALVLWSLAKRSSSLAAIEAAGAFAIHFLGQDHQHLAEQFASRGEDRFAGVDYSLGQTGAPLLGACIARLECQTKQLVDGGDHVIFIGSVMSLDEVDEARAPLVFHRGGFTQLQ